MGYPLFLFTAYATKLQGVSAASPIYFKKRGAEAALPFLQGVSAALALAEGDRVGQALLGLCVYKINIALGMRNYRYINSRFSLFISLIYIFRLPF